MAGQDHILSKAFLAAPAGFANNVVLGQCVTLSAGTTLDPNQVSLTTVGQGAINTATPLGLAVENLDLIKIQTGKAYFTVGLQGVFFGIADGAISVGAQVKPSTVTAGQLHTAASAAPTGFSIVGIAMTAAVNAGDIFAVLLTPGVVR